MSLHILHINQTSRDRPIRYRLRRDIRLRSRMRHRAVVVAVMFVRGTGAVGGRAVDSPVCALRRVRDVGGVVEGHGVEARAVRVRRRCVCRGAEEGREQEGDESDHVGVEGGHLLSTWVERGIWYLGRMKCGVGVGDVDAKC